MWSEAYLESRVLTADPIELVRILYEHALHQVGDARLNLAEGNIAARSKAVSRTIAVLAELDASLDHEVGGEISRNLAELYHYMRQRLLIANLQQDDAPLAEVQSLLTTLAQAWTDFRPGGNIESREPSSTPNELRARPFLPEPEATCAAHGWSA